MFYNLNFYKKQNNYPIMIFKILTLVLFFFIPLSLIAGVGILNFNLALIVLFSLFILFDIDFLKKYNVYIYLFIFFYLYLVSRSFLSINYKLSLEASLFYFRFFSLSLVIIFLSEKIKNFNQYLFIYLSAIYFLIFFDSMIQYIFSYNIIGLKYNGERVTSFFNDESILGSYISRILPVILFLLHIDNQNENNKSKLTLLFIFTGLIVVYISGERVALFNIFLIIVLFLIFYIKYIYKNIIYLIFLIIIIFLLSLYNNKLTHRYFETPSSFFDENNNFVIFSSTHNELIYSSINIFLTNKFFGVGPKLFRDYCLNEDLRYINGCNTHPHNIYAQSFSEIGILGSLPFIIIFLLTIYFLSKIILKYFKNQNNKNLKIGTSFLLSGIIISFFPIIPHGNLFSSWLNVFYFIYFGIIIFQIKNIQKYE